MTISKTLVLAFLLPGLRVGAETTLKDLNEAIDKSQWDQSVELAQQIIAENPKSPEAKLKESYALFQKGYSNAALNILRTLTPQDWKSLPQGKDRFVEIVSLFQKKVPLAFLPWKVEQIDLQDVSPYMADELRYLKGRVAYDHHQNKAAKEFLENVGKNSRYYVMARYLLGSIAAEAHDYQQALKEFSEVFEPTILDQSTEFWKDVGAQMTSHWGTNFKVMLDTEVLAQTNKVAELSLLGLARASYATKDYESAVRNYSQIPVTSPLRDRAITEKIWTLWNLNRHSEAQKEAAQLATDKSNFYGVKARILRALVLVDSGQTEEGRSELTKFDEIYKKSRATLMAYKQHPDADSLPDFIKADIEQDALLKALSQHQKNLDEEIKALKSEDPKVANFYTPLAQDLEDWKSKSHKLVQERIDQYVEKRISDLDYLHVQSKLVRAESYLEDREKLKAQIKTLAIVDEKIQRQYDEQLSDLLDKAIKEIDATFGQWHENQSRLQFRQAELFWELGTAKIILAQAKNNKAQSDEGESLRRKALEIIQNLAAKDHQFERYNQVLFFKGFAEMELGHPDQSIVTFKKYVQEYPKHEHVPDAYRILGDAHFDENQFADAEKAYEKVLEFPESPLVGYALYKLGWCAYNEKNFARTLLALEKAFLWTVQTPENKLIGLQKETRHDLISIYAEVGDDKKAKDYFKRFSNTPNGSLDWLVELSKQYDSNGQFEKAQNIYRVLIAMEPNSPDNLIYLSGIIQANYKLQKWDMVSSNLKALLDKYGSKISLPQPEGTAAFSVEKAMREIVTVHQFEFRASDDPDVINRVAALNELYFKGFELWPSSEEPLYKHAQYLLEKGRNEEAKEAFKHHWTRFNETLKEPLKEESLRNLIHTLGVIDEKEKSQELTKNAADLLTYAELYLSLYPKTKYTRTIEFVYSNTLLKYKKTEQGIAESQKIYDANKEDEFGKNSFKNLTKAYYDLKDWKRTYEWATTLKGQDPDIQIVREESYFLWAENLSDDLSSAQLFLKISTDPKMKKLWEKSLYNAFIRFNKAGKKWEALQAAEKLDHLSPNSPLLAAISGVRAAIYQEAGDYKKALPHLETFLKTADDKISKDAIEQAHFNLALIAEACGQNETARTHYKYYLAHSKGSHKDEAERGLARISNPNPSPSSIPFPEFLKIKKEREDFEKKPLVPQKDLVAELKGGAEKLERITKQFLDISNSAHTPAYYAVEIYCMLPILYSRYSAAIRNIGGKDKDLRVELEKVASPIDKKGTEFAQGCIDGALRTEVGGPVYEEVVTRWGWKRNPATAKKMAALLQNLEKKAPWLEPLSSSETETEIIIKTIKGEETDPQSWLVLARARYEAGKLALSRLTYIDALNRDPKSGALLNGLACVELKLRNTSGLISLYQKAGELGSGYAWINQAIEHLKGSRLSKAKESLKKAFDSKALESDPALNEAVKELTGP